MFDHTEFITEIQEKFDLDSVKKQTGVVAQW